MKKNIASLLKYQIIFIVSMLIFITACDKKEEKNLQVDIELETEQTKEEVAPVVEKPTVNVAGNYSGMFDQRKTTFVITKQDGNSFEGQITINYREVINQNVSGSFNPDTREVDMKDLRHSRYKGTYKGTFSADFTQFEGVFTTDVDGTKRNFKLNKN